MTNQVLFARVPAQIRRAVLMEAKTQHRTVGAQLIVIVEEWQTLRSMESPAAPEPAPDGPATGESKDGGVDGA